MPFVWKQRGIQTQSAQLWQGMQGPVWASKERKRERGDWEGAEEWKNLCQVGRKWCCFPLPPSIQHKHWAGVTGVSAGMRSEWDHISVSSEKNHVKGRVHPKMNTLHHLLKLLSFQTVWLTYFCRAQNILWRTLGSKQQYFWNMRMSKWWHNFHFWMNYCFNFCGSYGQLLYVAKQQLEHSA